jgi:hypothetical protein
MQCAQKAEPRRPGRGSGLGDRRTHPARLGAELALETEVQQLMLCAVVIGLNPTAIAAVPLYICSTQFHPTPYGTASPITPVPGTVPTSLSVTMRSRHCQHGKRYRYVPRYLVTV